MSLAGALGTADRNRLRPFRGWSGTGSLDFPSRGWSIGFLFEVDLIFCNQRSFPGGRWRGWIAGTLGFLIVFAAHLAAVRFLANDYDSDGAYYENLAQNVVDHHSYSQQTAPPFRPTLVRMPGYPLFLAGFYKVCGPGYPAVVRTVQAFIHTLTAVLLAALAALWVPHPARRKRAAGVAFALAAICPFTVIYAACILTETLTIFFVVAMTLCATMGWRQHPRRRGAWWLAAGACGGLAELQRPDAGLFVAAIGLTLAWGALARAWASRSVAPLGEAIRLGLVFSLGFGLTVAPWIARNAAVLHRLALLPPSNMSEPGVFSPDGYCAWFGTWSDDESDLPLLYWTLGPDQPMKFSDVPARAFDHPGEAKRVEALFAEYNAHPPPMMMTPEIDAQFAELARERIARDPWRSRLWLPLRRGCNLWFCTHSQYYDFEGRLFPLDQFGDGSRQVGWRALFAVATGLYTVAGIAGAVALGRERGAGWRWLGLLMLMIGLRMALLVRLEHTEPRYVVEFFPLLCVLGGIAAAEFGQWRRGGETVSS